MPPTIRAAFGRHTSGRTDPVVDGYAAGTAWPSTGTAATPPPNCSAPPPPQESSCTHGSCWGKSWSSTGTSPPSHASWRHMSVVAIAGDTVPRSATATTTAPTRAANSRRSPFRAIARQASAPAANCEPRLWSAATCPDQHARGRMHHDVTNPAGPPPRTIFLLASGLPILLRRMRSDFARDGSLRPSSAAAM